MHGIRGGGGCRCRLKTDEAIEGEPTVCTYRTVQYVPWSINININININTAIINRSGALINLDAKGGGRGGRGDGGSGERPARVS